VSVLTSMTGLTLNSLNTQSAKKLFTCQLCGKVLCSKASLKRHVADKHAERQEEYRCVICERVYCSQTGLGLHAGPSFSSCSPYGPSRSPFAARRSRTIPMCPHPGSRNCFLSSYPVDKHEQSDTLYVCEFCNRTYRTKNSLTTHKSLQHRGTSGVLRRLLKATAMKNVFGTMQHQMQMQQQPQ
ncbi:hypothetical protein ALC57_14991, partial [Trachymyrmex cornetzi]